MDRSGAETAIATSALVVAGIYAYRWAEGGQEQGATGSGAKALLVGAPMPFGRWVTAMGVTFLTLSIVGQVAPDAGGMLAITVAASTVLAQGADLFGLLGVQEQSAGTGRSPTSGVTGTTSAAGTGGAGVSGGTLVPFHQGTTGVKGTVSAGTGTGGNTGISGSTG